MGQTLRSGIVGTGFMGRVHAQAVQSNGGAIVGVVGSSLASAARAAERYPGAVGLADLDQLLAMAPDVIHVCTPNALHAAQAATILAAAVPVICEKPLATTVEAAEQLARTAATAGVVTGVPFVYRYHPVVREIRQRIADDPDNPLWLLHGSYLQDWLAGRSATNWRVDPDRGGASRAFGDIGVHWVDLMEFVTGHHITRVSAQLGSAFQRTGGETQNSTEDGGVVSFETDQGAIGSVVVSQASAGRKNRLWFSFDGPSQSYAFNQEQPETAWLGTVRQNMILTRDPAVQSGDAARPDALPAGHAQGYQQCFNDFVADVYSAVVAGVTPEGQPTFDDGWRSALVTQAVLDSARTQSWVTVPPTSSIIPARP